MFFTGSFVGPVIIRPRESVLTAVEKKRSGRGASAVVASTLNVKFGDSSWAAAVPEVAVVLSRCATVNQLDWLFAKTWMTSGVKKTPANKTRDVLITLTRFIPPRVLCASTKRLHSCYFWGPATRGSHRSFKVESQLQSEEAAPCLSNNRSTKLASQFRIDFAANSNCRRTSNFHPRAQ